MASFAVRIDGLAELQRALSHVEDAESLAEVERALIDAASEVAREARRRMPEITGQAKRAVYAEVYNGKAYVIGDKRKARYIGWLDFGSRAPQTKATHLTPTGRRSRAKWGPWKRSGFGPDGGRYINPAIDDNIERIAEQVATALERTMEKLL